MVTILGLSDQVCTPDQGGTLLRLGVTFSSYWVWTGYSNPEPRAFVNSDNDIIAPAFTVAELGEMLKDWSNSHQRTNSPMPAYYCDGIVDWWHCDNAGIDKQITCPSEATARAALLIYLLEKKLITT